MPRRTQTKPARVTTRSVAGGRASAKKAKTNSARPAFRRKDMRFGISLVILIGMLVFSLLLLLISLNRFETVRAGGKTSTVQSTASNTGSKKTDSQILNDSSLDFKITIPAQLGTWFYKIGEVKSLTDKSLSDQYLQIYVPLPGVKSSNFDEQNKNILTIRKFTADEWASIGKKCPDGDICKAAGEMIAKTTDSNGDDWVYASVKPGDCPKSIEARCALADKIIQSFQVK